MANSNRIYRLGNGSDAVVVEAPSDLTPEQVRTVWADVYPSLENAEIVEEADGSVTFLQRHGSKGL